MRKVNYSLPLTANFQDNSCFSIGMIILVMTQYYSESHSLHHMHPIGYRIHLRCTSLWNTILSPQWFLLFEWTYYLCQILLFIIFFQSSAETGSATEEWEVPWETPTTKEKRKAMFSIQSMLLFYGLRFCNVILCVTLFCLNNSVGTQMGLSILCAVKVLKV